MIRLLNLGPAEHEEVAIYAVNQRISNVRELREQLRCEAIRGYQVRGKILFAPNIIGTEETIRAGAGYLSRHFHIPLLIKKDSAIM